MRTFTPTPSPVCNQPFSIFRTFCLIGLPPIPLLKLPCKLPWMLTSSINCLMLPLPGTALILTPYILVSLLALAWLQAIPNPNLGLAIVGCELTCALRYWLSIPFLTLPIFVLVVLPLIRMMITFWAVARDLFGFVAMMFLLIVCSKLSFRITIKLKENSAFLAPLLCAQEIFSTLISLMANLLILIFLCETAFYLILSRASLVAGVASSAGEMDKDAKYDHNVSSAGCVFFPLVVETLGLWTDSSISLLRRIAARTTLRSGVSQGQAFHNLLQQLSVKLWSYNAKMLLDHISLLPVSY